MGVHDCISTLDMHLCTWGLPDMAALITRYGRASLVLLAHGVPFVEEAGLLTDDEVDKLPRVEDADGDAIDETVNAANTMWVWITDIMCYLCETEQIKRIYARHYILGLCRAGRNGISLVHHYQSCKLPMPYVHIISLFVKIQN